MLVCHPRRNLVIAQSKPVPLFDKKPVFSHVAGLSPKPHKRKSALKPLALEFELEQPRLKSAMCVVTRRPSAPIPQHHGAAAILSLWDRTLKALVFDWMVFRTNGETLVCGIKARASGHGPTLQDPIELEPQIKMQSSRIVLLHDKSQPV